MNIKLFFKFIAHSFTIHFSFSGVKNFLRKLKKVTGEEIMKKKHRCLFHKVLLLQAREAFSFFCAWTLLAVCLFSSTCTGWGTFILLDINEKRLCGWEGAERRWDHACSTLVSSTYIFSCHKHLPYNHFLIYERKTDFTCCSVTDVQHLMGQAQVDISDTYPF